MEPLSVVLLILIALMGIGWGLTFKIYRLRDKNALIREVRMRNRFVLIMAAYEQASEYLEAMRRSKIFDDMMLEHEPILKGLYDQIDQLADVMWSVFEGEDSIRGDLITQNREQEVIQQMEVPEVDEEVVFAEETINDED